MTHLLKILISLTLLMLCSHSQAQTTEKAKNPLENIQDKILTAFIKDQELGKTENLKGLDSELATLYENKKQNIILYWRAYNQYYTAIYHISKGEKDNSEKAADKAVKWLDNMKNKTSEDYALLSLSQGFSIQFKNLVRIIFLSRQIEKNGKLAIEKDSENLRAYYTLGSSDFYKPEKFGGGKNTEKYLLKAISLPAQKVKNPYLPSWGKEESYEMLIRWYIRKEQWDKARKHHADAIVKYPKSYTLNQLTIQLKNK